MRKIIKPRRLQEIICFILLAVIFIAFPVAAAVKKTDKAVKTERANTVLNVWQIDSFEGGKGSRADFLQNIGDGFSQRGGCYITVNSLSAEAARLNLSNGVVPDVISFGAGAYGLENYISDYKTWCHGGYCFLTTDGNADFADINSGNTVINAGKENLAGAAALLCGVGGADVEKSTGAYVKLISGKYKYLLGTQRDIFRLITRGVNFKVKAVTEFNDLYQNISVTAYGRRSGYSRAFIDYLLERSAEVVKLGLFNASVKMYDDAMRELEGISYGCKLTAPVSCETRERLENIISSGDINMLKNLLK